MGWLGRTLHKEIKIALLGLWKDLLKYLDIEEPSNPRPSINNSTDELHTRPYRLPREDYLKREHEKEKVKKQKEEAHRILKGNR